MERVFILNPCAGKGKEYGRLQEEIEKITRSYSGDVTVYTTKAVGDGERFVKEYCKTKGPARFIACGGDGTLSEVLNGAIGCQGAEIGIIPAGSGNDFTRNFKERNHFYNILGQMEGNSIPCDAIFYRTEVNGALKEGYCVNMFNIGFDCKVADTTNSIKSKTIFGGSLAYFLSILLTLVKKESTSLAIEIDGEMCHRGKLLLASVANGCYCGGGIKSNPLASVCDGQMDINLVQNISRLRLMGILPYYMKGTFLKLKGIRRIINLVQCKKITVTPLNGNIRLCIDGEIADAGKTEFSVCPNAFRLVAPWL